MMTALDDAGKLELVTGLLREPEEVRAHVIQGIINAPTPTHVVTPRPAMMEAVAALIRSCGHSATPAGDDLAIRLTGDGAARARSFTVTPLPSAEYYGFTLDGTGFCLLSDFTVTHNSTQLPSLLLDHAIDSGLEGNVLVTQPRRVAATSLARRVAEERAVRVGDEVGYQIRLESKVSARTRLAFMTTGVLLRRLIDDPTLKGVTHVIVDEVHERDLDTDFALLVLKDVVARRADIKVVLMSATINAQLFSGYFNGAPIVEIEGRTFPVTTHYLEHLVETLGPHVTSAVYEDAQYLNVNGAVQGVSKKAAFVAGNRTTTAALAEEAAAERLRADELSALYPDAPKQVRDLMAEVNIDVICYPLIAATVEHIMATSTEGAILVFLPGMAEILGARDELQASPALPASKVKILPLHSSVSDKDQAMVFQPTRPGVRKIVLTTNIAETSVTVDDVVFVIDSGKAKINSHNHKHHTARLQERWIARASANQRAGRAGRVRAGITYRLYPEWRFAKFASHEIPEMKRVPLQSLILQILALGLGSPHDVLAKAIEPPSVDTIRYEIEYLQRIEALDDDAQLTPMGTHLARFPLTANLAKMLVVGTMFRAVDGVLTIAAAMSLSRPLFQAPFEQRDQAQEMWKKFLDSGVPGDHIALVKAYNGWRKAVDEGAGPGWCRTHMLQQRVLAEMLETKNQYHGLLTDAGFLPPLTGGAHRDRATSPQLADFNENSSNFRVLRAMLVAGLYPNVLERLPRPAGQRGERLRSELKVADFVLHPGSLLANAGTFARGWPHVVYTEVMQSTRKYVRDATAVSTLPLILFSKSRVAQPSRHLLVVDGWLRFRVTGLQFVSIENLRLALDKSLKARLDDVDMDIDAIIDTAVEMIKREQ